MRIVTIVKRVPDSRATIKVKPDGAGIDTAGLRFVCDPFDEFGLEQGIQLKEQRADVQEVTALAAGPKAVTEVLYVALAMGAHRAVHVLDETLPVEDELAVAAVLVAAIRLFVVVFSKPGVPIASQSDVLQQMDLASSAGFSVLDMSRAYDGVEDVSTLWVLPSDRHPNAKAHRLLADELYELLQLQLGDSIWPRETPSKEPPDSQQSND